MRTEYDAAVIGAGLLGCFAARELVRYGLHTVVLEEREDICTGISRANSAIVYTGCDTKPGTIKTEMCVRANRGFDDLCRELGVRFSRCGSLMICFGSGGLEVLKKKYDQGLKNGVQGIRMLGPEETYEMEPHLASGIMASLYAEGTGTVLPWELCCAAAENAAANGAEFRFDSRVTGVTRSAGEYTIRTTSGDIRTRSVIDCAGLFADEIQEMLFEPTVRLFPKRGDYYVLDTKAQGYISHVIFHEPEDKKKSDEFDKGGDKGLTLVPTVEGNILVGPSNMPADDKRSRATERDGFELLDRRISEVVPDLPMRHMIRSFSSLRPNPFNVELSGGGYVRSGKSISNFTIMEPGGDPSFLSFIGIKTPGMTCAQQLGRYAAEKLAAYFGAEEDPRFDPVRSAPVRMADLPLSERDAIIKTRPDYGRIVCRCRGVSEGEIIDAIKSVPGAVTADGIKRRTGAGGGRCQGGFCTQKTIEILARELGCRPEDITKDGCGSYILTGGETDA
ncbi:MAG: FAD-dependent oxidoreductase [Oscillospiraceae bacterium]|nr:FAD-dependent oxidoreductase [Oscillospiraceae bacterium]